MRKLLTNTEWSRRIVSVLISIVKRLVMMIIAIAVVMLFLLVSGYDPGAVLLGLVRAFGKNLPGTIRWSAPMILAGISICIPFKANIYNLGVDGQIYLGAIAATWVALALPPMNGAIALLIVFLSGAIAGAFFALIPAIMNVYGKTDMVVSTLLMNFVGQWLTEFMAAVVMRDPEKITQTNSSRMLPEHLWLPKLRAFGNTTATIGIYIAIIIALITAFMFFKSKLGYEIKVVGVNAEFARYGGINSNSLVLKVMALSGAVAGIIGTIEVTAVQRRLIAAFNPGIGFDGIVVSLLSNNNPLGVILSGFFFGGLLNAGNVMQRVTDVPEVVTQIIMAIIILAISGNIVIKRTRRRAMGENQDE